MTELMFLPVSPKLHLFYMIHAEICVVKFTADVPEMVYLKGEESLFPWCSFDPD